MRMAEYARRYNMVMIVPVYEKEQPGVLYNTAAVIDADGTYLGKYRKNHIPHTSGFLGEVLLQTRQPRATRCFRRGMRRSASISAMTGISRMEPGVWG